MHPSAQRQQAAASLLAAAALGAGVVWRGMMRHIGAQVLALLARRACPSLPLVAGDCVLGQEDDADKLAKPAGALTPTAWIAGLAADRAMHRGVTEQRRLSGASVAAVAHLHENSTCCAHCLLGKLEELSAVSPKRCWLPWSMDAIGAVVIVSGPLLLLRRIHRFAGDGERYVFSGTAASCVPLPPSKPSILAPAQRGPQHHRYPARGAKIGEDSAMVENQEKVTSSDAAGSTHESVSAAVTSAGCYSVSGNSAHEVLQQVAIGAAGSYDAAALEALQYPLSPRDERRAAPTRTPTSAVSPIAGSGA
ncbi:hypothetical protein CGC21_5380 [Leishmania donovani]|uniref:Uncharacterized protein n=1 Tax=Leishmania donovani TaxID=5661 RepID=A0A504XP75_LEIDO|nr:hypothetical protein CGC21_5380 [Leishmania donovani]